MRYLTIAGAIVLLAGTAAAQDDHSRIPTRSFSLQQEQPPEEVPPERIAPTVRALRRHEEGELNFSLRGGAMKQGEADNASAIGLLDARVWINESIAVQVSGGYSEADFFDGDFEVRHGLAEAALIVSPFPRERIRPYAMLGGGYHFQRFEFDAAIFPGEDDESIGDAAATVGAGVEFELTRSFSLSADGRYTVINFDADDLDFVTGLDDRDFDYWAATGGLDVRF